MRFNVLHLIADDLRTSIGAYGHTDAAKTPHLDRLAAQGVVFENAYSQIAVCTPSRNSFMTGRNPDTTGVYNDAIGYPDFRASPRGHHWTTLPGHFAKHGYFVTGLGKTYHPQSPADDDVAGGWEAPPAPPAEEGQWGEDEPVDID